MPSCSLSADLSSMFDQPSFSDCTLVVVRPREHRHTAVESVRLDLQLGMNLFELFDFFAKQLCVVLQITVHKIMRFQEWNAGEQKQ